MVFTLGRLWYLWKRSRREGWLTPYYRDYIRPRILGTPPIETASAGAVEVHLLTSAQDLLNAIWALKAFYYFSKRDYPLVIYDDGSLEANGQAILSAHFPNARIIDKKHANQVAFEQLRAYPRCEQFRRAHNLSTKAIDTCLFAEGSKVVLLDSDVLFFARPSEVIEHADDARSNISIFNADVSNALNISAQTARTWFQIELVERINTGLAVIPKTALNLSWMEEFLACDELSAGNPWRVEQTILALAACRGGAKLLPSSYRVSLEPGLDGCVMKHYVGAVRHLMYREGIAHWVGQGFLTALKLPATVQVTD